jgi:hypothetical protein
MANRKALSGLNDPMSARPPKFGEFVGVVGRRRL